MVEYYYSKLEGYLDALDKGIRASSFSSAYSCLCWNKEDVGQELEVCLTRELTVEEKIVLDNLVVNTICCSGQTDRIGEHQIIFNTPSVTIANGEYLQLYRLTVPTNKRIKVWTAGLASTGGTVVAGAKIQLYNETDAVEAYATNSMLVTGEPIGVYSLEGKSVSIKILNDSGLVGDFHAFLTISIED